MTTGAPSVDEALARYAAGAFPMDDAADAPELPWYVAPERAVFELDAVSRGWVRKRVRRSVRACDGHQLRVDSAFETVLELCAVPPDPDDGVWITDRMKTLYRSLFAEGFAHSFELWSPDERLAAGILCVGLGRAVMLESMRRTAPHAGNALLVATLDWTAERGVTLCDIQLPTPHTRRLGCRLISQAEYESRLREALA